jgi:hypothetical protein
MKCISNTANWGIGISLFILMLGFGSHMSPMLVGEASPLADETLFISPTSEAFSNLLPEASDMLSVIQWNVLDYASALISSVSPDKEFVL